MTKTARPVARLLQASAEERANLPVAVVLPGQPAGCSATEAAQRLADDGINAIAVDYFARAGENVELASVEVLEVAEAIAFAVSGGGLEWRPLVLVGHSRGTELAFLLETHLSRVVGIANSSPSAVVNSAMRSAHISFDEPAWLIDGVPPSYFRGRYWAGEYARLFMTGQLDQRRRFNGWPQETRSVLPELPSNLRVLLQYGDDDRFWPSADFVRRLRTTACSLCSVETVRYRGCGHMGLFPGSTPGCEARATLLETMGVGVGFGGTKEANRSAADESYRRVLRFIRALP